eukprot:scaffold1290_cov248-Ochromonas_danica.AAC.1
MNYHYLIFFFIISFSSLAVLDSILHPEEFPNLLAGSFTDGGKFSTGNTLPLVGLPWGFNHWAPQTKDRNRFTGSWWFFGSDHTLTWMRCTHQPSPWIGDWGYFHFTPQIGDISHSPRHFWEPRGASIKPYSFDATVAPFNIRIQLAPTDHGAMVKITFPSSHNHGEKHICFASARWTDHQSSNNGGCYIVGESTQVNSDRMIVHNFGLKIRAESKEAIAVHQAEDMLCFKYPRDASVVTVRMATSLISHDQVMVNMRRELQDLSFEEVYEKAKTTWNQLMKRIDVLDSGPDSSDSFRDLTVFYTGLYRALTFPRRLDEVDDNGHVKHYSPYDRSGRVFSGPLVTDNGLWDTFRTVYPLLSLAYPDHLGNIVQGWLNAYKEGEWLPSWASPGYRNCMVGTFADVVIADAIVKDVQCFEKPVAINALSKDAYQAGPPFAGGAVGKEGLSEYINRGYLPVESGGEVVSRTLDYGFADFSTSKAFLHLEQTLPGLDEEAKKELHRKAVELHRRSVRAFNSLFDSGRGLMVPKDRSGRFSGHWSSIEWGNGYTEGNAWHHSFPPYAVSCATIDEQQLGHLRTEDGLDCNGGLAALYGGKAQLLKKLQELLDTPSNFQVGSYNQEIHEMTEMRAFAMGQYGHNNQPVHHILYLFALLDDPKTTQRTVREVLKRGFGEDFYAGDEDNGEQGAWFVLSALGLFSVTPGTPDYILSSPLFKHVRIVRSSIKNDFGFASCATPNTGDAVYVSDGRERYLDIFAKGTGEDHVYVKKVLFNGTELTKHSIHNAWLMGDGILQFVMEGDSVKADLQAIHATPTHLLQQPEKQAQSVAEKDKKKLQSVINEQQELIDHLQKELSKEKAMLHDASVVTQGQDKSVSSQLQLLVDIVCYVGLLVVAVFTIAFMLRVVITLLSAESGVEGAASNPNSGSVSSRWKIQMWISNCAGCARAWGLWLRSKFSSISLQTESKPSTVVDCANDSGSLFWSLEQAVEQEATQNRGKRQVEEKSLRYADFEIKWKDGEFVRRFPRDMIGVPMENVKIVVVVLCSGSSKQASKPEEPKNL